MTNETYMELIDAVAADESIPDEYRDELEWISYEDLEDGVDLVDVLSNLMESYPAEKYPSKLQALIDAVFKK